MKVKTLPANGAEPVIISLRRPPMFLCKAPNTNRSQILFFRIMPLKKKKKNKHRVKRLGYLNDNRIRRQTKLFNFVFFRPERHVQHDAFEKVRNNVRHFRLVDSVEQTRDTGHNRRLQHLHIFKQKLDISTVKTDRTADQIHAVLWARTLSTLVRRDLRVVQVFIVYLLHNTFPTCVLKASTRSSRHPHSACIEKVALGRH